MPALKSRLAKSPEAYRSIGEAAAELGVATHVLRYWETRFPEAVRPMRRDDGRRFFRPEDLAALRAIKALVHDEGLTLKEAQARLAVTLAAQGQQPPLIESPARALQESLAGAFGAELAPRVPRVAGKRERLVALLGQLTDLRARIEAARGRCAA